MIPILTERLILGGFDGDTKDVETMAAWLNDRDVTRFSEQRHSVHNATTQLAYINSFHAPDEFRLIRLRTKEEPLIGTATAYIDYNNGVADVGILIGEKTIWNQGVGTEAWIGMIDHLFDYGLRKIEAGCMAANRGMVGIFRKSKMHKEGERQDHFKLGGTFDDMELWARFNPKHKAFQ